MRNLCQETGPGAKAVGCSGVTGWLAAQKGSREQEINRWGSIRSPGGNTHNTVLYHTWTRQQVRSLPRVGLVDMGGQKMIWWWVILSILCIGLGVIYMSKDELWNNRGDHWKPQRRVNYVDVLYVMMIKLVFTRHYTKLRVKEEWGAILSNTDGLFEVTYFVNL